MNHLIKFLEKYFVPVVSSIGSQRHLVAIRDGFVSIMPLIIVGSLSILFNNLPIPVYQDFMQSLLGEGWTTFADNIFRGTVSVMSLLVVFSISYNLAHSYRSEHTVFAGLISLAALMTVMEPSGNYIPYQYLDAGGLFVSILIALVSTEIFVRLMKNKKIIIKMPGGVPPAINRSFAVVFPALIVLGLFAGIKVLATRMGFGNVHQILYNFIQEPLAGMANTLGSAIIIVFTKHILWFFGLHGSNILEPVMQTMYLPALQENMNAMLTGVSLPNIVTKPFLDTFVYMGGCGTTLSLILAILISSGKRRYRELGKLSIAQGIFNINEPVLYGLPIVMNPVLMIPFIITPVVLTVISYMVTAIGIVPHTVAMVPWTTPPVISGFLVTGSITGSILQLINIAIGTVIYLPFIKIAEHSKTGS